MTLNKSVTARGTWLGRSITYKNSTDSKPDVQLLRIWAFGESVNNPKRHFIRFVYQLRKKIEIKYDLLDVLQESSGIRNQFEGNMKLNVTLVTAALVVVIARTYFQRRLENVRCLALIKLYSSLSI